MAALNSDILDSGILIVDDESPIATMLRRMLNSYGFGNVVTALNGEQGLKIIENADHQFAAVLSDQHMPVMGGYEFLGKVADVSPDTRRLLITGYRDFRAAIDAINKGGIHKYITKPWNEDHLLEMISGELVVHHRILEKRRLHTITKNQNARIYQLARRMASRKESFKKQLASKKALLAASFSTLEALKKEAGAGDSANGLDPFFLHRGIEGQIQLHKAFEIIEAEIDTIFAGIAGRLHFARSNSRPGEEKIAPPDYTLTDLIIGSAVRRAEPLLMKLYPGFDTGIKIEAYTRVPEVWELAYQGGFISTEELDTFEGVHYTELWASGRISRLNLSRLVTMRQFIQIRLEDQKRSGELIRRGIVSSGNLEIFFEEQMKRFLEDRKCSSIGDILLEKGIIDGLTREELFEKVAKAPPARRHPETKRPSVSGEKIPLEMVFSQDGITAWIKNSQALFPGIDQNHVKRLLKRHDVIFGHVADERIEENLRNRTAPGEKWIVAEGIKVTPGKAPTVVYFFKTDYQQPGIVRDDGTIDFMERGDIPFVGKGDLLARKIPGKIGTAGCTVFGEAIEPEDVGEVMLTAGVGTRLSDEGLELYATVKGQPCLEVGGAVSVYEELIVKKDVDFETGHIDFQGNVFVFGSVKEGFRVNCVNLTVSEVNGGIISTTGDLNVSKGVINADVSALGNVTAKFINHSSIEALGDMIVTREIMGSRIMINGELHNKEGRITASVISAGMGFDVYRVGTERSKISVLKPGSDDYIDSVVKRLGKREKETRKTINELTEKGMRAEAQNLILHKKVTEYSHTCEILKRRMLEEPEQLKTDSAHKDRLPEDRIPASEVQLETVERDIRKIFDAQDALLQLMDANQAKLEEAGAVLEKILLEKRQMRQLKESQKAIPVVKVRKRITAGTKVMGPNSSLVVRRDEGACRILEIDSDDADPTLGKEMVIHSF